MKSNQSLNYYYLYELRCYNTRLGYRRKIVFIIDASKKQDIIIAGNNAATYAEALPEMASEILGLYENMMLQKA